MLAISRSARVRFRFFFFFFFFFPTNQWLALWVVWGPASRPLPIRAQVHDDDLRVLARALDKLKLNPLADVRALSFLSCSSRRDRVMGCRGDVVCFHRAISSSVCHDRNKLGCPTISSTPICLWLVF